MYSLNKHKSRMPSKKTVTSVLKMEWKTTFFYFGGSKENAYIANDKWSFFMNRMLPKNRKKSD